MYMHSKENVGAARLFSHGGAGSGRAFSGNTGALDKGVGNKAITNTDQ